MTDHPPTPIGPRPAIDQDRLTPGRPGGISLEEVAALVESASGADAAAIEGLEAIASNPRRAHDARTELAARVPPQMLRQVLITRASTPHREQPEHAVLPDGRPS